MIQETEAARGGTAHDATSLLTDDPLHFPAEEPRASLKEKKNKRISLIFFSIFVYLRFF